MTADIILLLRHGIVLQQYIVVNSDTAEATVDLVLETVMGDDYEEVRPRGGDYNVDSINEHLRHFGRELIWLTEVEVNTYENGEE